ncbi:hypothetical protein SNE40_011478 [Patella caerulea]|uniref:Kin17 KOW domain-containing protein n=1 Tax=Patella caerulea TaxID=87958 RepID=A0AAN8JPF2_PATCE
MEISRSISGLSNGKSYCRTCKTTSNNHEEFLIHVCSEKHKHQRYLQSRYTDALTEVNSNEYLNGFLESLSSFCGRKVPPVAVQNEYLKRVNNSVSVDKTRWGDFESFIRWMKISRSFLFDQNLMFVQEKSMRGPIKRAILPHSIKRLIKQSGNGCEKKSPQKKCIISRRKISFPLQKIHTGYSRVSGNNSVVNALNDVRKQKSGVILESSVLLSGTNVMSKKKIKHKKSALDEVKSEIERERETFNRSKSWLAKGLVVQIITDRLGKSANNKTGTILYNSFDDTAVVKLNHTEKLTPVHQNDLQSVIPPVGQNVRVVNGGYRGMEARLESIDNEEHKARVEIKTGLFSGRILNIHLNDICEFKHVS